MTITEKLKAMENVNLRNKSSFRGWSKIDNILKRLSFVDLCDHAAVTLNDLFYDWVILRDEEPENHSDNFLVEVFEILMATVNGRNDLEIVGITKPEANDLINWMFWHVM